MFGAASTGYARCVQFLPLPARREFMTSEASVRGLHCAEAIYPAGLQLGMHAHEHASITVIAGGEVVEHGRDGRPTRCERGVVIIRPGGDAHGNAVGRAGVINVEVDLAPEVLVDHRVRIRDACTFGSPAGGALARRLRRELRERSAVRSLLVESIALELVALALAEPRHGAAALARAHDRICSEFRARLSIAELARDAGMHPVSFARAFRARYGASPGELVRARRIAWAAGELRRRPEATIAEIAAAAGFYDQSHFTRAFVARLGRPPARYRRDDGRLDDGQRDLLHGVPRCTANAGTSDAAGQTSSRRR
jgi:AraC family transcriptional regulator